MLGEMKYCNNFSFLEYFSVGFKGQTIRVNVQNRFAISRLISKATSMCFCATSKMHNYAIAPPPLA